MTARHHASESEIDWWWESGLGRMGALGKRLAFVSGRGLEVGFLAAVALR